MVLCKSTAIDKQIDREITTLNNVRSYLDEKRFIYPLNSGKKKLQRLDSQRVYFQQNSRCAYIPHNDI